MTSARRPTSTCWWSLHPAEKPGAFGLSRLVAEAQDLFGRDVDIVVGTPRDRRLRAAVRDEGVVLYGRQLTSVVWS